ncbi:DUF5666 domain-containing protein [Variovorax sp. J22G21]|uniref:DUF5666 domain-containing protein n=1 Tax=Variovorax fucosicus TaxID=3053517 RepID=UPI002574909C|nr:MULTISPECIES: DUF5666 domain-containing protein [unclassified Variovorax]MDM0042389.1 DUF5666 domain-containing protein [Variovorax sp. J22R193]MDM0060994.1 DUF5666 domain-containing protein [Variovorax sp. J22G21]
MTLKILRGSLVALSAALLLACGGGDGGGGAGGGVGGAGGSAAFGTAGEASGFGVNGGSGGGGGGGNAGDGSASTGGAGSTTTAATGGGDDSGVGSGGTGVSTADAVGIGAVDGLGSIIVNGLRYNTDSASLSIEDAPALQIGMTARVTGPVGLDFTTGVATQVASAADLRGPMLSADTAAGRFVVWGTTVTTDAGTVWADAPGLAAIPPGATLQVWGLPAEPGVLRATRVEQRASAAPIVTGTVQNLDTTLRTFTLGGLTVNYGLAVLGNAFDAAPLANGAIVRVRASVAALPGPLVASLVQPWYPVPATTGVAVQLGGIVSSYAGSGSFRVFGTTVDASSAQITGGPAGSLGNGVRVEVAGTMANGVLKASKLKLRHVPGTGGPAAFTLIGTVGNFVSPASFRVRGQPVDASGASGVTVVFSNGTAANLGNGVAVTVSGSQIADGRLIAEQVVFR